MSYRVSRPAVAGLIVVVTAGLAVGGCGGSAKPEAASCLTQHGTAGTAGGTPSGSPDPAAAGWTSPGGNLANTRAVTSAITSSDVSKLGVAWCVPVESTGASRAAGLTDGYATTPVVVGGVVYTQDQESNVMAIELATGKVLWAHDFNSPNGGPDGVNVVGGTVYVSTVPINPAKGQYLGGAKSTLWALNAATGAPQWSWDEVQDLWGHPGLNSGGGLWDPPSFDAQGNLYIGSCCGNSRSGCTPGLPTPG